MFSFVLIAISLLATKVYCIFAKNTKLMDKPNERSLHVIPTVRGGGLIFIGLFLVGLPIMGYVHQTCFKEQIALFASVLFLALISFCDDLYTLSAKPRFAVQCLISSLVSVVMRPESLNFVFFSLENQYVVMVFLFVTILWAINHFNFMDGLDGFCGTQALFLFFAYALLFGFSGGLFYKDLSIVLIVGLIGFLVFNFPPAQLFMGDVGSASLGFICFYFALIAQKQFDIPILYWFLLNALFVFDSTITLLRRVLNGEQWFAPHRKHAYQRLRQSGIHTRSILLGQSIINSLFLIVTLFIHLHKVSLALTTPFFFALLFLTYMMAERRFPMS